MLLDLLIVSYLVLFPPAFNIQGNVEGGIDVSSFQVTDTAQHFVKSGIIEACLDPTVVRVKEAGTGEYVPEVSYKSMNEYKVAVQQVAKPTFPVDYLIVSVCVESYLWVAIAWI